MYVCMYVLCNSYDNNTMENVILCSISNEVHKKTDTLFPGTT